MLASEIRNSRLSPQEINEIISSSGLLNIKSFYIDILKKSRNEKISPLQLLKLQGKIAEKIIYCEKQMAIFKKTANREKQNDEWRSREIYSAHRRMLMGVMDGVAFRFLNFDRPVLRQLAQHNQAGHLTIGFIEELKKAEYVVNETGYYVILNDLTNYLRHGDLTIISPEKIYIVEVKTSGKAKGDQKKILDELIRMLNNKTFRMGDQVADYIRIPGKPLSFAPQVERIINISKQTDGGVFAERISPYLWVSSVSISQMMNYFKSAGKLPDLPKIPFNPNESSPSTNNLLFFDEFSPNIMPYSAFPFSEENIFDIVTGQIQLKVVVSEKELVNSFKGKGWNLSFPSRESIIAVYDTDDINKINEAIFNPAYFDTISKGNFRFQAPREVLLRIQTEFRSAKSIIHEAEELMSASKKGISHTVTTSFSGESLIWK